MVREGDKRGQGFISRKHHNKLLDFAVFGRAVVGWLVDVLDVSNA